MLLLLDHLVQLHESNHQSFEEQAAESNHHTILIIMMKGFGLGLLILILSIFYLDAFLPPLHAPPIRLSKLQESSSSSSFEHADIVWKLRPSKESTSKRQRLWLRFAANVIRLDCMIKRQEPPLILCPKGRQAVLEAHVCTTTKKYEQIGRFGFTTMAGPSNEAIQETIHDLYGLDANRQYRAGAIIYMFVEEEYRKKELGKLALQAISLIQSIQACDFTMLVVDDNGSGKLIEWYEQNGYQQAPKLQTMLGSPNAIHGVTMMAPTNRELPENFTIKWW